MDIDEIRKAAENEQADIPKLRVIYGEWWRHYAYPQDFRATMYAERDFCPYCENALPPYYTPRGKSPGPRGRSVIEHMDPLKLGGEDSPRNCLIACARCNREKGSRPFLDWLKRLTPHLQDLCRNIYVEKHGHEPEEFIHGEPTARVDGSLGDLLLDLETLQELYPEPIVSGPPERSS